jgi:hypothetical protein
MFPIFHKSFDLHCLSTVEFMWIWPDDDVHCTSCESICRCCVYINPIRKGNLMISLHQNQNPILNAYVFHGPKPKNLQQNIIIVQFIVQFLYSRSCVCLSDVQAHKFPEKGKSHNVNLVSV